MRQTSSQQTVQIQEPTLKEIKKHSGWFTGSCVTGAGCIVIFIGAIYLLFRIIVGSGPTVLSDFPADFPKDIPQSNPDKIIKVTSVDGASKDRSIWVATAIPRFLASPVLSEINPDADIIEEHDSLGRVNFKRELSRENYLKYLGIPIGSEHTRTVVVTWNGIKSYPSIFVDGIEKALERANYIIETPTKMPANEAGFSFSRGTTSGVLRAIDLHTDQPGIEFVQLIVNY
jgi:hypothetical protein